MTTRYGLVRMSGHLFVAALICMLPTRVRCQETWIQKHPAHNPSPRSSASIAYDEARKQIVLFGGYGRGGVLSDTWLWNGEDWTEATPSVHPRARNAAPMTYDAARQQIVLFGGHAGEGTHLSDTWIWDGSGWTQAAPHISPPARGSPAMAYDGKNRQVVLFGGLVSAGQAPLSDTWIWDGSGWAAAKPSLSPPARRNAVAAYDSARRQIVLFGGMGRAQPFSDTWTWNGDGWDELQSRWNRQPESGIVMMFDNARQQVVLYTLTPFKSDPSWQPALSTWNWDGNSWTKLQQNVVPSRLAASMAYDAARNQVVLFGGAKDLGGQQYLSDTWVCCEGAAQQQQPTPKSSSQHAANRALLIGQTSYRSLPSIQTAVPDVQTIGSVLKSKLGFNATVVENIPAAVDIKRAIESFISELQRGDVCLVYFAGYGFQDQENGENYLLPLEFAPQPPPAGQPIQAYSLSRLLNLLDEKEPALRIVILDTSFPPQSIARFAEPQDADMGNNTLIVFFQRPKSDLAMGGGKGMSPFAEQLIKALEEPGLPVEELFQRVKSSMPDGYTVWDKSTLSGKFYLRLPSAAPTEAAQPRRVKAGGNSTPASAEEVPMSGAKVTQARFGIETQNLPQALKDRLGLKESYGVVVTDVKTDSFAEDIGLLQTDIILSINGRFVASVDDVTRIQATLKPGDAVAFRVMHASSGAKGGPFNFVGRYVAGILPANP